MKKKVNLDIYMSYIEIILKQLYKKGYSEGKKDALKQFKKETKQKGESV